MGYCSLKILANKGIAVFHARQKPLSQNFLGCSATANNPKVPLFSAIAHEKRVQKTSSRLTTLADYVQSNKNGRTSIQYIQKKPQT